MCPTGLPSIRTFHIHGDNIIECERAFSLIIQSFEGEIDDIKGPLESAVAPSFYINTKDSDTQLKFTFFPGYGRWTDDILSVIRAKGGLLREAADVLLTHVVDNIEQPLIAIEYCGALPAGNQAWQRNGRAYSFALAKIPYVYVTEIGGYELASDRSQRSPRLPNPAVPFSYLALSTTLTTFTLPVFVPNAGASSTALELYKNIFGHNDLLHILHNLIIDQDYSKEVNSLKYKVLEFVKLLSSGHRRNDTLTPVQWGNAFDAISVGKGLVQYVLNESPIHWTKTAYISSLTKTSIKVMSIASKYGVGLTSSTLPICIISANKRLSFLKELMTVYPDLPISFTNWCNKSMDLTICWVMGFKPRGDDARPDRGLPPLTRMLIGEKSDLLTFIYGPAPSNTWPRLQNTPRELMQANGLWESIMTVSDAIIIDSATASNLKTKAFIRNHWEDNSMTTQSSSILIKPEPLNIGENDVDTVLHILFSRFGKQNVFEGMCNPPGGDWSGMSLLSQDRIKEFRWLSLPRVTSANAKRPDHLFQIFNINNYPIIFVIESKEKAISVEDNIGSRLTEYTKQLITTLPNVQRDVSTGMWNQGIQKYSMSTIQFASAAAFILGNNIEFPKFAERTNVDIVLGLEFSNQGNKSHIYAYSRTKIGQIICNFISSLRGSNNIEVSYLQ